MFLAENENGAENEISWMTAVQLPGNWFELATDRYCDIRHCPLQIINAIKSDYVATATAAEAWILFELRPTISRLSQCVFFDISKTVYGGQLVFFRPKMKKRNWNIHIQLKTKMAETNKKSVNL